MSYYSLSHRNSPSPTKQLTTSFSRAINNKTPEFPQIYPQWLIQRNDFQEVFKEYESLDSLDLYAIFQKDSSVWKDTEIHAIDRFIQSSYFFANIFSPRSLMRKFSVAIYNDSAELPIAFISLILKGKVLIDNELLVPRLNAIGELQLNEQKAIPAIAVGRVETVQVDSENYKTLFMHPRLKQLRQVVGTLKKIEFFSEIKQIRLEKIAACAISIQYESGEEIYHIGDSASYFFIVISGKVELSSKVKFHTINNLPIGLKKREKLVVEQSFYAPVVVMNEGECFGLGEVVGGGRKTNAKTAEKSVILAMNWKELLEILNEQEKCWVNEKVQEKFSGCSAGIALKKKIISHRRHITALMQASELKGGPYGRETFEEIPRRKRAYARLLCDKQEKYLAENLVSKSYSFRDVVLPKLTARSKNNA